MTCLVWDRVTFAFDSQVSSSQRKWFISDKAILHNDCIIATTGCLASGIMLRNWYQCGADPDKFPTIAESDSATLIVINQYGILEFDGYCIPREYSLKELNAWGSGSMYALGAMDQGATALEALRIAMKRDPGTGGKIRTLTLEG